MHSSHIFNSRLLFRLQVDQTSRVHERVTRVITRRDILKAFVVAKNLSYR